MITTRTKAILPGCVDPTKPADGEWRMDGQVRLFDVAARSWSARRLPPASNAMTSRSAPAMTLRMLSSAVLM